MFRSQKGLKLISCKTATQIQCTVCKQLRRLFWGEMNGCEQIYHKIYTHKFFPLYTYIPLQKDMRYESTLIHTHVHQQRTWIHIPTNQPHTHARTHAPPVTLPIKGIGQDPGSTTASVLFLRLKDCHRGGLAMPTLNSLGASGSCAP